MEETKQETKQETTEEIKKTELKKIISEFLRDLLNTFPELKKDLDHDLSIIYSNENGIETSVDNLTNYFKTVYPERFFDILYENDKIFSDEKINTNFLPGINFKNLWKDNITGNTRKTLWKYLQLILFSVVSDISDKNSFKDTASLFQAVDEDEFKQKLEDTINSIQELFKQNSVQHSEQNSEREEHCEQRGEQSGEQNQSEFNVNASSLHEHISGMMNGKLGALAKEIAEETAKDLNIDTENTGNMNDLFQDLLKNPTKLMKMVKNVGSKLDEKLKSGDLKESELLQEASEMMKKMKNMPGMENINSMMGKLGLNMGGMGGNQKLNTNAMQAQLQRNLRIAQQRERMKNKIKENNLSNENKVIDNELKEKIDNANNAMAELLKSEGLEGEIENYVFRSGDKPTKSKRKKSNKTSNKPNNKNK
jgi:hypothetical protein